jgi:membrane fusion protein, multidrug efflux system
MMSDNLPAAPDAPETASRVLSPRARRILGLAALVLVLAAALAWLVHWRTTGRFFEETNDATIQADQVAIAAKLPGYVRRVAVADNQAVAT